MRDIKIFRGQFSANCDWSNAHSYSYEYQRGVPGAGLKPIALASSNVTEKMLRPTFVPS